ncbi:MAG: ATP-binding cassette domain-containing protein [Candidatus Aenigmarchaeota archaeon]|nr:ATP-binding cassette domain-containing protein [Candidatus Aenigmarchaeota archaeon]
MSAIEIKNLTKKFGDFTAVDSINLTIKEGELFGLLGPNGAGKTTTISMLATIMPSTSGEATVNGFDLHQQSDVRRSIGIVFQDPSLDDELTGRQNLEFHARVYHLPHDLRKQRIEEVLTLVELSDKADMQVKTYSGGMKRRLEIARGLLHHPKILFLDEPTLGLDPQTRRNIWEHIERLNKEEKITIILTTHYMEEADYLCDRIGIIDHGKIIALDTPEDLKNIMGGDILTLETHDTEKLKNILDFPWVKEIKVFDGKMNVTAKNGENAIPIILGAAAKHKIHITSVNMKRPTLEDVFIHYTGRTIRDEEASDRDRMRMAMRARGGWRR